MIEGHEGKLLSIKDFQPVSGRVGYYWFNSIMMIKRDLLIKLIAEHNQEVKQKFKKPFFGFYKNSKEKK